MPMGMMIVMEGDSVNDASSFWPRLPSAASIQPRLVGFPPPEHLRLQKSILLSDTIPYTTNMSTVTSDAPVAKVPQVTGMRKNGESFSTCQYRACVFYCSLLRRTCANSPVSRTF